MPRTVAAILVAVCLFAAPAVAADPVDVQAETKDGETVKGSLKLSSLKIDTEFGSATVDPDKIRSVTFGDPDVVVTTNDVELRGKVTTSSFKLTTADGKKKTLKRSALASLVRMEGGLPSGASSFDGQWAGTWGPMKLKQSGLTVKGTYGFSNEFKIEGTVKGKELKFEYREPNGRGSGAFELWDDGNTFTGTFQASGNANSRFWGGYRIDPKLPKPQPGKVVEGQSESWLNFHLRVPKDYDPKTQYPAIAFFHGSNMTSRAYVDTIASAFPKLAEDYILVGFDGEKISSGSQGGNRVFNFTYINYSGPDWGAPFIRRQSPALVGEALVELKKHYPIKHWLAGGHSQGGFLTYAILQYFPGEVAGVFPMSCNLLVQCEPDNFSDEKERAAQRAVAVAPIHGKNDNVVEFSSGQYCHQRMLDGGYPTLHFFTNNVGHQFALLPVEEAVRWLETMVSGDAKRLVELAGKSVAGGNYRDALAALARARDAKNVGDVRAELDKVAAKIEAKAKPEAEKLEKKIKANKDGRWVDDFLAFREQFAFADAAKGCMRGYQKLRDEQTKEANELFYAARNERDKSRKKEMWQRLVDECYASKWYPLVKRWLDN